MKYKLILLFIFCGSFQLFSFSFGWRLCFQNNSNSEIVYSIKYVEETDYKTYVCHPTDVATLYSFQGFPPVREKNISLLTFNNSVEDIIMYDVSGNVIMLIDDIRKTLSAGDYIEVLEITEELIRAGNEKYRHLPQFTGDVINFPKKTFYIQNDSGTKVAVIAYFRTVNGFVSPRAFGIISSTETGPGSHYASDYDGEAFLCFFSSLELRDDDDLHRQEFRENDGITLFYNYLVDITLYDADGRTILTKEDFVPSRFVETIDGSEKYGDRSFTMTITLEDIALGREKYKHIRAVNIIEKRLEALNERRKSLNLPPEDRL